MFSQFSVFSGSQVLSEAGITDATNTNLKIKFLKECRIFFPLKVRIKSWTLLRILNTFVSCMVRCPDVRVEKL